MSKIPFFQRWKLSLSSEGSAGSILKTLTKKTDQNQTIVESGETTQWVRALLLLLRSWVQSSAHTKQLTTGCNFSSRGPDALLWPLQALHVVLRYTIHTCKSVNLKKNIPHC